MTEKTFAVIRATFMAAHCWPAAPDGKHEHLRNPHRHVFHVELQVLQFHDDREIEYFEAKDLLTEHLRALPFSLGSKSCEMIAADLIVWTHSVWGNRPVRCLVSEDGENGALVESI